MAQPPPEQRTPPRSVPPTAAITARNARGGRGLGLYGGGYGAESYALAYAPATRAQAALPGKDRSR